jgi:hypothetical protein
MPFAEAASMQVSATIGQALVLVTLGALGFLTSSAIDHHQHTLDVSRIGPATIRESPQTSAASSARSLEPPQMRAQLQAAFLRDAPDAAWTDEMKRDLEAEARKALPAGSLLKSLECHSSLCRMETSHADEASYTAFIHNLVGATWTQKLRGPMMSTRAGDDTPGAEHRMVSFFSRSGWFPTSD